MKFERRLEALSGELCGEAFSAQMARFLPLLFIDIKNQSSQASQII